MDEGNVFIQRFVDYLRLSTIGIIPSSCIFVTGECLIKRLELFVKLAQVLLLLCSPPEIAPRGVV